MQFISNSKIDFVYLSLRTLYISRWIVYSTGMITWSNLHKDIKTIVSWKLGEIQGPTFVQIFARGIRHENYAHDLWSVLYYIIIQSSTHTHTPHNESF